MKFKKKPVVIDAVLWDGTDEAMNAISEMGLNVKYLTEKRSFIIETLEGSVLVPVGRWVIRGVKGEFYSCRSDIFEKTYEPA